jgi:pimeloyl-ACP methyl ester carboxylesterase
MSKFKREALTVDGVKTVVYSAGSGDPVVFFHGAGTVDGFDFAEPWADRFKVIVPYHPGFGESGDDPSFTDLHDYIMHYLELFDLMGLDRFHLVGLSLGGYLAAKFASEHGHRVKKLALIAPAGIIDPKHPTADVVAIPGEEIVGLLVSNFDVLKKRLPEKPDLDFIGERYRESATVARLLWEHPADPKFMRHLHRIKMPTLILWGDEDKLIPVQQTETWRKFLPQADIQVFKGAGHLVHLERPEAVAAVAKFLG